MKRSYPSPALVIACVALFVALGGTGYAATHLPSGTSTATPSKSKSKRGPRGVRGPQGLQGIPGTTGTTGITGAPGPGAMDFVFNSSGTASPTPTTLGHAGPFSLSGECVQSGSSTKTVVLEEGPSTTIDGFDILGATPHSVSVPFPAHPTPGELVGVTSTTTTPETYAYSLFLEPSSGSPVDTTITIAATGGTTDTCHASMVVIPTS